MIGTLDRVLTHDTARGQRHAAMRADIAQRERLAAAHAPEQNRFAQQHQAPQSPGPEVAVERGEVPEIAQEQLRFPNSADGFAPAHSSESLSESESGFVCLGGWRGFSMDSRPAVSCCALSPGSLYAHPAVFALMAPASRAAAGLPGAAWAEMIVQSS